MKFLYPFFLALSVATAKECACPVLNRPKYSDKEESARWMIHTLDWGVLSTISTRLDNEPPFGNVYSFVDGPCDESSGTPYFYGSHMDQSLTDTASSNKVSFTLSEAAFPFTCHGYNLQECEISAQGGDPENPMCARLTVTGTLIELDSKSNEYSKVQKWMFQRHTAMADWPDDHEWVIAKLEIEDIWFIDFFGGADVMSVDSYFAASLNFEDVMDANHHHGAGMSDHMDNSNANGSFQGPFGLLLLFMLVCAGSVVGNWLTGMCSREGNHANYQEVKPLEVEIQRPY